MKNFPKRLTLNKPHPRTETPHAIVLVLTIILVFALREKALGNDIISGYNSFIFRSYSDLTFKGINGIREEVDNDHYTFYDFLNIRQSGYTRATGFGFSDPEAHGSASISGTKRLIRTPRLISFTPVLVVMTMGQTPSVFSAMLPLQKEGWVSTLTLGVFTADWGRLGTGFVWSVT